MRTLLLLLIVSLTGLLAGCTMVETPSEHARRWVNITDVNLRQASEDVDYILLLDRSSRLNQWHTRVGY